MGVTPAHHLFDKYVLRKNHPKIKLPPSNSRETLRGHDGVGDDNLSDAKNPIGSTEPHLLMATDEVPNLRRHFRA